MIQQKKRNKENSQIPKDSKSEMAPLPITWLPLPTPLILLLEIFSEQ